MKHEQNNIDLSISGSCGVFYKNQFNHFIFTVMFSFSLGDYAERKSPLLKIFADAEAAANSAAIQLVSFKDALEDEFAVCLSMMYISMFRDLQYVLMFMTSRSHFCVCF